MSKVSIIIPVYNVARYLSRCIDSVLKQDNIQIEVLLVNDGSTDSSGDICDEYARRDERVRVFHQNNNGVSSARNEGINNATGYWVCFVDADDWVEPNSLARVIEPKENTMIDIIIAKSFVNRSGSALTERYPFKEALVDKIYRGINLLTEEGYVRGSVWGVIYNRRFLLANNIYFPLKLRNGEDSIFYSICTIYAEGVKFTDTHFYNVYEREGSASRSWSFDRLLTMVDNISYINKYISSHPKLSTSAINLLNSSKYGVISNVYNNFHHSFSIKNYFVLRKKIKSTLKDKIDTGSIKTNKNKVKLLNFSLDLFAIMILGKNKIST